MPAANKNKCPICGGEKTSWSIKCQDCEHERKRLVVALERRDDDASFLDRYDGWSLSRIATDRHVSRERARQQKESARRRLALLTA